METNETRHIIGVGTEGIAKICHEANKAYCEIIGDNSQPSWEDAPQWQKDSAMNGVMYHRDNPDSTQEDSHKSWMTEKLDAGWKYGEVKDPEAKTHPCITEYLNLPLEQQRKDALFLSIVRALD